MDDLFSVVSKPIFATKVHFAASVNIYKIDVFLHRFKFKIDLQFFSYEWAFNYRLLVVDNVFNDSDAPQTTLQPNRLRFDEI